jgi:hypothetical protein
MRKSISSVLAGSGLVISIASTASAHIELIEPLARYEIEGFDTGIKSCPCGVGSSNRTCNVAVDSSDPNRSERVTRYEAGSTITLRFNEYVNHVGRYRVAFDPDGADIVDFNANILTDIPDPANANDVEYQIEVTLPDMTCDNCTLQLVQAMNNNMVDPVLDPSTTSSYYTCVDIELVAPGTLGDTPAPETPAPEMPGGEGEQDGSQAAGETETPLIPANPTSDTPAAMGPASPTTAPGGMMAMNDMMGTTAVPSTGTPNPGDTAMSSSSDGGCNLAAGAGGGAISLAAFGVLAALGLRRRSREARR